MMAVTFSRISDMIGGVANAVQSKRLYFKCPTSKTTIRQTSSFFR